VKKSSEKKAFSITSGKGVQFTFPNKYTISIQWGAGNYCGEYPNLSMLGLESRSDFWESNDAEIAIFANNDAWVTKIAYRDISGGEEHCDDVIGYLGIKEVLKYIIWTSSRKEISNANNNPD